VTTPERDAEDWPKAATAVAAKSATINLYFMNPPKFEARLLASMERIQTREVV
jgi:hypothetical protein